MVSAYPLHIVRARPVMLAATLAGAIVACSSSDSAEAPPVVKAPATNVDVFGAVDAYLVAYRDGILARELQPTDAMWAKATAAASPLSASADFDVRRLVASLLDDALGFDFVQPTSDGLEHGNGDGSTVFNKGRAVHGFFRSVPDEATSAALIEAVRAGVAAAFEKNDSRYATGPIVGFFSKYPDYHPMHTGRCYPHGHADYSQTAKTPADCVSDEVRRGAGYLLRHAHDIAAATVTKTAVQEQRWYPYGNCGCYWSGDCPDWGSYCYHGLFQLIGCQETVVGGKSQDGVCSW